MITCPFCDHEHRKIKGITKKHVIDHLLVTRDVDNNFHVHGPIKDKSLMERFLRNIAKEAGIVVRDRTESEEEHSESPEP
jgi:hypothetical protein